MKQIILIAWLVLASTLVAQEVPSPAPAQENPIVLTNAKLFTGSSEIEGYIAFDKGKIIAINAGAYQSSFANATIIDCKGKNIYPGLIAPSTSIGLKEIEALRQTLDANEVGRYNPNVRSLIAYSTDSRVTPTIRSNGILLAEIAPEGGSISGTASVVQLDAWNWEDAAVQIDHAIYMNWPASIRYSGWWAEPGEFNPQEHYQKQVDELKDYFAEAKAYAINPPQESNIRFDAMKGLFNKQKKLFIRAEFAKDMIAAVLFAEEQGISPVLVGGAESYLILDFLKDHQVPIILNSVHRTPTNEDIDVHLPYELPSILAKHGILFCLSHEDYWQVRNLPFLAGTSIAHGLSPQQGLQSITLNPAKILGIDDRVGSLEVGKDATLIVSDGDIFDVRSSNILLAFIQGREIDLGNKQKDLYKKFGKKYNQTIYLPSLEQ